MKKFLINAFKVILIACVIGVILIAVALVRRPAMTQKQRFEGRAIDYTPDPMTILMDYGVTIDFDKSYNDYELWYTAYYKNVTKEAFDKYINICVDEFDYRIQTRSKRLCTLVGDNNRIYIDLNDGNLMLVSSYMDR